ncbi:Averantin hydroxylase [Cyphellophora attinorum]|uniref:Averantin hydroxylase n=1 Tax=Cyphellophora attinorum TaxID=1664694 RepID=A0A0N0NKX9_9EURO|nr:Averantin hydroxylase [Phialophora attinorum]KPI38548.1 Averantin hydroxylase [Phialophora attinorum]
MLLNRVDFDVLTLGQVGVLVLLAGIPLVGLYKILHNLFLHPLRSYPGPLLARATLFPSAYHAIKGDFYLWLSSAHHEYGPTVRLAPNGLSFTDPAGWNDIYNAKPQLPKAQFSFPPRQEGTGEGILMATDEMHARLRRLIGPGFSGRAIEEMEPVLQQKTSLLVEGLRDAGNQGEVPLNMQDWAQFVVTDIIGVLAMGVEFECLEKRDIISGPAYLIPPSKR